MACPADTWKVFVGDAACDPCPLNSSSTSDRTSCICNAGYYGGPEPELNEGCTACPRDTKQREIGQHTVSACIPCKRDATAPPGSTMCVCKANTYGKGNSDTLGDNCTACPTRALSPADSRLLTDCKCAEGLYGNFTGLAGNASCSACPPNATTTLGAVSRADCFCPRGYYGNPANGFACQVCPPNSTSPAATTAFSGCVCKADFYGDPAVNISCVKCPDDSVSPEGSRQLESCNCKQGFFGTPGGPRTTTPAATPLSTPAPAAAPAATTPMTNVTNMTNVTDMTTPAPVSASSLLPSTCHACNNCPETHFGEPITNFTLNRPSSVHKWNKTGTQGVHLDSPQFSGSWFRDAVALACRVEFAAGNATENKMLWSFGNSTTSTSLRFRDASTTPKLRLLTCNSIPPFQCSNYTSDTVNSPSATSLFSTNAAMIDVIDFPRDGRFHEVNLM